MAPTREIVVTGVGVASPIGIGCEAFWQSLCDGRSGVRSLDLYDDAALPSPFGAAVTDFDPKQYVRPRKSLKVMSRDIQLAFLAADLACVEAGFREQPVDPEQLGIVFGAEMIPCNLPELIDAFRLCIVDGKFDFARWGQAAMAEMYPLWMLKYLPNMPACHIGIAQDARGPNNSVILGDVSSLSAAAEAVRVIERGHADVMIVGGTGSRISSTLWARNEVFEISRRAADPAAASRPFDAQRDGMVNGEGAGAFIFESREHADARGATVLARVLGFGGAFERCRNGRQPEGRAIRNAIGAALRDADIQPSDVGHVNANGSGAVADDRIEAAAIRDTLADVPVTAPKSFFGHLGAGTGAVEMVASALSLQKGLIPPTLNYEHPDPECPVNVVHGRPIETDKPIAMMLNHTSFGQAAALVLAGR
ncbi:MAG: beta-ketoacyl-[acyl-carrier-protein] synthase family protein [Candidatus Nealsonbacteria bacterium]|nr:beta-ketoacyl-[acyl-carrier-protein] synthase family protein [Candidatus Nealsonbacteria bacterium]